MNNSRAVLLAALVVGFGVGCQPRKVPEAPDPVPDTPSDPNQPVPNPAATVGQPIGPIAASDAHAR